MELSIKVFDQNKPAAAVNAVATLSDKIFNAEFNEALIHQVVTAYLAAGRAGTHQQKRRCDVSGGGKKPWKQKGSGRARAGTTRGPIWRGGGVTFAAVPQDYSQKVNKKMYAGAIRSIFAMLVRETRLNLVDEIKLGAPKTKELLEHLKAMNLTKVLVITDGIDHNLNLASRNLLKVNVLGVKDIDPVSLVAAEQVLLTLPALKKIEEIWG